jgi:hypothetical protein
MAAAPLWRIENALHALRQCLFLLWACCCCAGAAAGGRRSPLHSVDVESVESTEDSHSRLSWLPKIGRK